MMTLVGSDDDNVGNQVDENFVLDSMVFRYLIPSFYLLFVRRATLTSMKINDHIIYRKDKLTRHNPLFLRSLLRSDSNFDHIFYRTSLYNIFF